MRTEQAMRRAAIALGIAIGGTGCMVGPRYQAPETRLAPLHNASAAAARNAELPEPPLDRWWTGFRDPVLTRIVQRALAQNFDLSVALAPVHRPPSAARPG